MTMEEKRVLELASGKPVDEDRKLLPSEEALLESYRIAKAMLVAKYAPVQMKLTGVRPVQLMQADDVFVWDAEQGRGEVHVSREQQRTKVMENIYCLLHVPELTSGIRSCLPAQWQATLCAVALDGVVSADTDKDTPLWAAVADAALKPNACIFAQWSAENEARFQEDVKALRRSLEDNGMKGAFSVYLLTRSAGEKNLSETELLSGIQRSPDTEAVYCLHQYILVQ